MGWNWVRWVREVPVRRRGRQGTFLVGLVVALMSGLAAPAFAEPRIVQPAADATVHSNAGDVPVTVADVPAGLRLLPLLDGKPHAEAVARTSFVMHGTPRGTHRLVVALVDEGGHEVGRTAPVEFHVWRASRLFRQRDR